jgi:pilus assembly protein Flp/PilA
MLKMLENLLNQESGQDLVEYALLAMFISISAIAMLPAVATNLITYFSKIAAPLT